MAVVMQMHWSGVTPEQYERLREYVNWETLHADGGKLHIAGFDDDGINVTDVWESPEQFQRFIDERLTPGIEEVGVPGEPEVRFYEFHRAWSPDADLALT
jgi:hypothetical protein